MGLFFHIEFLSFTPLPSDKNNTHTISVNVLKIYTSVDLNTPPQDIIAHGHATDL